MELDELKASWQRLDRRVADLTAINRKLLSDALTRKARWRLVPVVVGAALNVLIGAIVAVMAAAFWSSHLDAPPAVIAGIALHVAGVSLLVIGVGRLELVRRIDFTGPVLEIQRALASLQRWEAWSFHVVWLGCWLLVPATVIAIAMAMTGVDLWERASGYVLANLLVCLAGGLAPMVLHLWARRRGGRLAAWMDDFLTSHSIARTRVAIAEIDEFARV